MEWFDLVQAYEERNGSFANADYDNPDYVKFRVQIIMLENDLDVYDAITELAVQVANPGGKRMTRKKVLQLQKQYEREFYHVLHLAR